MVRRGEVFITGDSMDLTLLALHLINGYSLILALLLQNPESVQQTCDRHIIQRPLHLFEKIKYNNILL